MKTIIAKNKQGASVVFTGKSKTEALRNFKFEYSVKGWKFEYLDENGKNI